jgi:uncharacterized membrane protein
MADEVKVETKTEQKSTGGTGLEPNVAALLAYLFDIVGGLIFFLIEKENKFVRFAGAQSMALGVLNLAMWWVVIPLLTTVTFGVGFILWPVYSVGYLVIRIMLMVKAYNNEEWELPVVGKISRGFIK